MWGVYVWFAYDMCSVCVLYFYVECYVCMCVVCVCVYIVCAMCTCVMCTCACMCMEQGWRERLVSILTVSLNKGDTMTFPVIKKSVTDEQEEGAFLFFLMHSRPQMKKVRICFVLMLFLLSVIDLQFPHSQCSHCLMLLAELFLFPFFLQIQACISTEALASPPDWVNLKQPSCHLFNHYKPTWVGGGGEVKEEVESVQSPCFIHFSTKLWILTNC